MKRALVFSVARLESDDYSVPRGSHGIGEPVGDGLFHIYWLPPQHGGSVPVLEADLADGGELVIPEHLVPPAAK